MGDLAAGGPCVAACFSVRIRAARAAAGYVDGLCVFDFGD